MFVEGALPGERSRIRRSCAAEVRVRDRPRRRRPARERLEPAGAALPAFRRLRRLQPAARRRAHADGRQAALARGEPRAHRQGASPRRCCRSSTARRGAIATARGCRCATCRRRAACWSASTSGARATSPTCASATCCPREICDLILPLRALVGGAVDPRAAAADRGRGRRQRDRAGAAASRCRSPMRTVRACSELSRETPRSSRVAAAGRARNARIRSTRTRASSHYELPEFGLSLRFRPTEFTQVNHGVNRMLVARAVRAARPAARRAHRRLFCGLGNFSLPLATRGAQVVGVEGSSDAGGARAANAALNGLAGRTVRSRESRSRPKPAIRTRPFDKLLIDPPREGAVEIVKALPRATLAAAHRLRLLRSGDARARRRRAGPRRGYRLAAAGVVNMFPHTAHVESIALFERSAGQ